MRITFLVLCMIISASALSQDYIYKKDGSSIAVEDVNAEKYSISYKLYNDPAKLPQFILAVVVDSVTFRNGTVIRYPTHPRKPDENYFTEFNYPKSNTIFFELSELIYSNITLGYEYKFLKKRTGLSLTLSKGYNSPGTWGGNLYKLLSSSEFGLKTSINLYLIDATYFSNGINVFFTTMSYRKIKQMASYDMPFETLETESASYNGIGLGVFANIIVSPELRFIGSFDLYIFDYFLWPVPRFGIGISF